MATVRLLGEDANPDIYQTLLQNYKTKAAELPQVSDAEIENAKQMQQYGTLANAVSKLVSSAGSFQGQQAKPMDFSEIGESGMRDVALKRQQQQDKLNLLNSEYGKDLQAQQAKDAAIAGKAAARRQAEMDEFTRQKNKQELEKGSYTLGQKKVDEEYAKKYEEWTSTGLSNATKNLAKLQNARTILEKYANSEKFNLISGNVAGRAPEILRTEESRELEQNIKSIAQESLKAILGTQFTDNEGQRIMKDAYDPTLSAAANLRKLDSTLKELHERFENQESKRRYFEENNRGTIRGWKAPYDYPDPVPNQNQTQTSPTANSETVVRNGITYKKVPGGWRKQ
jgi:hypothetical protein